MAQWKHEYTEPPIDQRVKLDPPVFDPIRTLDGAMHDLSQSLNRLVEATSDESQRQYLAENAPLLFSDLVKLQGICSLLDVERKKRKRLEAAE